MSCYVVERITIDRILTGLAREENRFLLYILKGGDYKSCYMSEDDFNKYGKQLWKMNRLNYDRRYPKQRSSGTQIESLYYYQPVYYLSRMQFFKSLQCFLYQCNDSDLVINTKLYRLLNKIKGILAIQIIGDLPEYESAKWE